MKKILITGASGFVGRYFIDYLDNLGEYEIYGTTQSNDTINTHNNVNYLKLDLTNQMAVHQTIKDIKPDYIVNLAALSSVKESWNKPAETMLVNVIGTIYLLDAIKEYVPESKVLLIGSSEEYGSIVKENPVVKENIKCIPENIYAISKYTQGEIGRLYSKYYNMNIVTTRSFNHTGPSQSANFVVSDFCKQVAKIEAGLVENVIKVGNLSAARSFTDVRDIVNAYHLLLLKGKNGETYNVGSSEVLKIEDILNRILGMSKTGIKVEIDKNKFRPNDIPIVIPNVDKLREDTGWNPKYNINDTISDVLDYWRNIYKNQNKVR